MTLAKIQAATLAGFAVAALAAGVGAAQQPAAPAPPTAPASTPVAAPAAPTAPVDSSDFMPPNSENYGLAVNRLRALERNLAALRQFIRPVETGPEGGGLVPARQVPDHETVIEGLREQENELTAIRQSIEPVPASRMGTVPMRVEPSRPVPSLVKQPAPDPAPPAIGPDRLRAMLREAEATARYFTSGPGADGPAARLKIARVQLQADAFRRRLEEASLADLSRQGPEQMARVRFELDEADRIVAESSPTRMAGDERYARDLAAFRDRARAEVAALRAKLPPNPAPATEDGPPPVPDDPALPPESLEQRHIALKGEKDALARQAEQTRFAAAELQERLASLEREVAAKEQQIQANQHAMREAVPKAGNPAPAGPVPARPPAPAEGADDTARLIARTMPWELDPPAGREGGDPARAAGSARVRAVAATVRQLQRLLFAPPPGAISPNLTFERLALWSGRLTDAQLDVADGRDARVAALADGLKRAQDLERLARDLVAGESNGLSEVDIAIAAFARADAEARLRREQDRPADPAAPANPELTRTEPAGAPARAPDAEAPAAPGPQPTPAAAGVEPEPTIETLKGSPTILMVVPPARDRVTMIDPATGRRATLRLARPAESIRPVVNAPGDFFGTDFFPATPAGRAMKERVEGLVGLELAGPRVEQAAIFDRHAMTWFEHPLPRPASRVTPRMNRFSPLVGIAVDSVEPTRELVAFDAEDRGWPALTLPEPVGGPIPASVSLEGTVAFEAGRFLAIYSRAARKSSVQELKHPRPRPAGGSTLVSNPRLIDFQDGRLIVPDGDLIRIYDPKTGEWAEIGTGGDQ